MNQFRKIIILLLFVVGNIIFAQQNKVKSFKLDWQDNVEFVINNRLSVNTSLIKDNFLDENLNPIFNTSWQVGSNIKLVEFSIKNVVFENIESNDFYNPNFIEDEISAVFNIVNAKNNSLAVLNLSPIVKVDNHFKRIVSFDLAYSITSSDKKTVKSSTIKNSVLASGNWYKFSINKTGVYKIDKDFLKDLGVNVNSINPKNIGIYGNGGAMLPLKNSDFRFDGLQENAIFVSGENDNSFGNDDYILFYAQGPHSWNYNLNAQLTNINHQFNIFSDESFYFLFIIQLKVRK